MSSFNFISYVDSLLPSPTTDGPLDRAYPSPTKQNFTVRVLTGGLTNHTARLSFANPLREVLSKIFSDLAEKMSGIEDDILYQRSAILKHAPPYIAADPSQPMSVDRQLIEKMALQFLNPKDEGLKASDPSSELGFYLKEPLGGRQQEVRIPKLIWHDRSQNVLWIEDLGEMRTLSEVLLDQSTSDALAADNVKFQLTRIASDLGAFLSNLFSSTSNPSERLLSVLTSSSNTDAFRDYLANMVLENLQRPEASMSETEAHLLANRVRVGLEENAKLAGEDVCLGMVDFWPESVLVDLGIEGSEGGDRVPRCGLVDWEYFGPSNAASELGMFLAHLHVHLLNSTTSAKARELIQLFAEEMLRTYVELQSTLGPDQEDVWKPSVSFKRRALLAHGRELVNGTTLYEAKLDNVAKKQILTMGVRSLRAAGDSVDTLNLEVLQDVDKVNDLGAELDVRDGTERVWRTFAALEFN